MLKNRKGPPSEMSYSSTRNLQELTPVLMLVEFLKGDFRPNSPKSWMFSFIMSM